MTSWALSTTLITGAASGMGRGMTLGALSAGGDVMAWDLDEAALAQLRADAQDLPGSLRTMAVDVTDREAVDVAALATGDVDIVVNNAGVVGGGMLTDDTPSSIERVMNVNAMALFWVTRAFLPSMIERDHGHLVTVASAAGLVPLRQAVSYTASKHAAVGFHDSLRQELRQQAPQMRTTLVTPFFVNTGMFDGVTTRFAALLPVVEQDDAVSRIMTAVEKNKTRVIMPATAMAAYAYRMIPTRVAEVLLDQFGVSSSMEQFHGREAAPAEKRG